MFPLFIHSDTNQPEALTTSSIPMSCPSVLPVPLTVAEAEGLALPPWSVGSPECCEEHGESLSVFCLDDLEPLCKQCAAVSHGGHRVYLLTEAATDCKEELRASLNGLKKKMTDFEKVTQTCDHAFRHNQTEAKRTEELMKKEFESLHQFLKEEEAVRVLALREKHEEKKREAEEKIDKMDQVIKCLEERIELIEEELDAGGDGVEFLERYQDSMNSEWTGDREPKICRPLIDVAKHLGNLQYAVWEKMKHIAPYTPVTLDPRTAGLSLSVSPGLNSVHITPGPSQGLEQGLDAAASAPANPERFHPHSRILAREGFDSGVHCWDIEVGDTNSWTVGVAAQSVSRRTEFEACPEAGLWCISLRDGEYRALTTPSQALNLNNSHRLNRVCVRLDWDEGTLAFMNADTETHLFTFKHCFTEKVFPYFESLSSCGGLAVLAQSVDVNVGSDYVSVEDICISDEDKVRESESYTEGDIKFAASNGNHKISECEHVTEDKHSVCSVTEEKTKPQRNTMKDQLIKTKLTGKEKTKDNSPAVKKQSSKPRFGVIYHVSLNRALNISNNESSSHKQIQINHVDHLVYDPRTK